MASNNGGPSASGAIPSPAMGQHPVVGAATTPDDLNIEASRTFQRRPRNPIMQVKNGKVKD
jgi:hypothetical protein